MIGMNDLRFNRATMAAMVQHYFDTVLFKAPPKVLFVAQQQEDFLVRTEAPAETKGTVVMVKPKATR